MGNDSFIFATDYGADTIIDFTAGAGDGDVPRLSLGAQYDTFAEVMATAIQSGANTILDFGASSITLTGVAASSLVGDDFLFV